MPGRSTSRMATFVVALTLGSLLVAYPVSAAPACSTAAGQAYIDAGRYDRAVREFGCVIDGDPTSVDGHRGRMEALVLLGRYSHAVLDGVHFNAVGAGASGRRADDRGGVRQSVGITQRRRPHWCDLPRWWFFDYPAAIHLASRLLEVRPDDRVGNLFRGSSRLLHHVQTTRGIADLEQGIASTRTIRASTSSPPMRIPTDCPIPTGRWPKDDRPRWRPGHAARPRPPGRRVQRSGRDADRGEPHQAASRPRDDRACCRRPRSSRETRCRSTMSREDLRDRGPGGGRPADRRSPPAAMPTGTRSPCCSPRTAPPSSAATTTAATSPPSTGSPSDR